MLYCVDELSDSNCVFSFCWLMKVEHEVKLDRTEVSTYDRLRELLGLEPVRLVIRKSRLMWFGQEDCKDNVDGMKTCTG